MPTHPTITLAVLALNVVISEWLVRKTFFRHFGTALLVIVVTAVVANVGIIPTSSVGSPVFDGIFGYVAPLSIFWLLLQVNLRDILKAGLPMVGMFVLGAVGTTIGVMAGMWAVGGRHAFGETYRALGGMFVGTYVGGSVNFNALALHYDITREGVLYGATTVVDNIMTALWMIVTIAVPRLWVRRGGGGRDVDVQSGELSTGEARAGEVVSHDDVETVTPSNLGMVLAIGLLSLYASEASAAFMGRLGLAVPGVIILTTLALVLGQLPIARFLRGAQVLGMFGVYLFLATIGAYCDVGALSGVGSLGVHLFLFVVIVVGVHGLVTFGVGALLRLDMATVAVASQANIGGGTSALALARSLDRHDLTLPAILVGSLGYAMGTYLGFLAAGYLL